jgi:hypothetical protein
MAGGGGPIAAPDQQTFGHPGEQALTGRDQVRLGHDLRRGRAGGNVDAGEGACPVGEQLQPPHPRARCRAKVEEAVPLLRSVGAGEVQLVAGALVVDGGKAVKEGAGLAERVGSKVRSRVG